MAKRAYRFVILIANVVPYNATAAVPSNRSGRLLAGFCISSKSATIATRLQGMATHQGTPGLRKRTNRGRLSGMAPMIDRPRRECKRSEATH
jgi:hypothetical protein